MEDVDLSSESRVLCSICGKEVSRMGSTMADDIRAGGGVISGDGLDQVVYRATVCDHCGRTYCFSCHPLSNGFACPSCKHRLRPLLGGSSLSAFQPKTIPANELRAPDHVEGTISLTGTSGNVLQGGSFQGLKVLTLPDPSSSFSDLAVGAAQRIVSEYLSVWTGKGQRTAFITGALLVCAMVALCFYFRDHLSKPGEFGLSVMMAVCLGALPPYLILKRRETRGQQNLTEFCRSVFSIQNPWHREALVLVLGYLFPLNARSQVFRFSASCVRHLLKASPWPVMQLMAYRPMGTERLRDHFGFLKIRYGDNVGPEILAQLLAAKRIGDELVRSFGRLYPEALSAKDELEGLLLNLDHNWGMPVAIWLARLPGNGPLRLLEGFANSDGSPWQIHAYACLVTMARKGNKRAQESLRQNGVSDRLDENGNGLATVSDDLAWLRDAEWWDADDKGFGFTPWSMESER